MRTRICTALIAALALIGCKHDQTDPDPAKPTAPASAPAQAKQPVTPATTGTPAPSASAQRPDDVMVEVFLPSLSEPNTVSALAARIDPSVGPLVAMQLGSAVKSMVGELLEDASVIDTSAPIRIVWLNGKKVQPALIFIGQATKGSTLKPRGDSVKVLQAGALSLVGSRAALEIAAPYAVHLSQQPINEALVVAYPKALVTAYAQELDSFPTLVGAATSAIGGGGGPDLKTLFELYVRMAHGMGEQVERIEVSVPNGEAVRMDFIGREGTDFATFCAAQRPATHALANQLPARDKPAAIVVADLHGGPFLDALLELGTSFMGPQAKTSGFATAFKQLADIYDGTMAFELELDGPLASGKYKTFMLAGHSDEAKARKALVAYGKALAKLGESKSMGMSYRYGFKEKVLTHQKVPVSEAKTSINFDKPPAGSPAKMEQVMLAAVLGKQTVVATSGTSTPAAVKPAIDAALGKGKTLTPSAPMAAALARAAANKASLAMALDIKTLSPGGNVPLSVVSAELGFAAPRMRLDIVVTK